MALHTATMTSHFKSLYKLVDDMGLISDLSFEDGKDVDMEVVMKWMSKLTKDNKPRVKAASKGNIEDALKVSEDLIEETKELGMWMKKFGALVRNTINEGEKGEEFKTRVKTNLI